MRTDVMFSSKTDLWETPQDLFDKLDEEFYFDLDVCALPENAKCEKYYTPEQDGLSQPWSGACWCNPPYGKNVVDKWVKRAWEKSAEGATVVMLLPARTDTKWFHEYIYKQDRVEVRFLCRRLKFGNSKNSAPFPSMVVIFRPQNYKRDVLGRITEKRDGQNVIPLRMDGKSKWAICSSGMGHASTDFLYGDHANKLADYEDAMSLERVKELSQAEKDGRLVVLQKNNQISIENI